MAPITHETYKILKEGDYSCQIQETMNRMCRCRSSLQTSILFLLLFARTKFRVLKKIVKVNAREKDAGYKTNRARENSKHAKFYTRLCKKIIHVF